MVASAMPRQHAVFLEFVDAVLEAAWREHQGPAQVAALRTFTRYVLVPVLILASIRDLWVRVPGWETMMVYRWLVLAPLMFLPAAATNWQFGRRRAQDVIVLMSVSLFGSAVVVDQWVFEPNIGMGAALSIQTAMLILPVLGAIMLMFPMGCRRQLVVLASANLAFLVMFDPQLSDGMHQVTAYYVMVAMSVVLFFGSWVRERTARGAWLTERALADEQERSHQLLLNILPEPIAVRLMNGESPISDRIESATVLFADMVGFTRLAANLEPSELVSRLDRVFTRFDDKVAEYGFTKIKTIGDAYMTVGGLPWDGLANHELAGGRLALDLLEIIKDEPDLDVRIGLNTGPVVAGVIGKHRFVYDLWGDTVNLASRMESTGLTGEVQVTQRTMQGIGDQLVQRPRGQVEVKGKGLVETWLLSVGPGGNVDPWR
jgi:class 3 adenylate cyclase